MKILLIDNESVLIDKLEDLIPGNEIVQRWNNISDDALDNYDLVILSGSSLFSVVGNENKFSKEIDLIKNSKIPILGICFGCELIASTFGGRLKRLPQKEKGIVDINVSHPDPIFGGKGSFKVYSSHQWTIDSIPSDFLVLAESINGPEIIKHKTMPIYGFQFHPENLTDKTYGDELFINLLNSFIPKFLA